MKRWFCRSSVTTNSNWSCLVFKKEAGSRATAEIDLVMLAADPQTHCAERSSQASRCFPASGNMAFRGYPFIPNSNGLEDRCCAFSNVKNQDRSCLGWFSMLWGTCTEKQWVLEWVSFCNTLPCSNCLGTGCSEWCREVVNVFIPACVF